jgi:hypothetical protein
MVRYTSTVLALCLLPQFALAQDPVNDCRTKFIVRIAELKADTIDAGRNVICKRLSAGEGFDIFSTGTSELDPFTTCRVRIRFGRIGSGSSADFFCGSFQDSFPPNPSDCPATFAGEFVFDTLTRREFSAGKRWLSKDGCQLVESELLVP